MPLICKVFLIRDFICERCWNAKVSCKIKKTARLSHFHKSAYSSFVADTMLSNSNFKVYVGDRWIRVILYLNV